MDSQNNVNKKKPKPDCIHCGWAMGEREGEPLCDKCGKTKRRRNDNSHRI